MSAFGGNADIVRAPVNVRYRPKADMGSQSSRLNLVYFDVSDLTLGVGEAEATKNSPY